MAFSDSQFNAMQEEAIRRVREMHRRSQSMVGPPSEDSRRQAQENTSAVPAAGNAPAENRSEGSVKRSDSTAGGLLGSLLGGNLGSLKIDEEKALIGLLIYILYKQGADVKLLLGLGYLLL